MKSWKLLILLLYIFIILYEDEIFTSFLDWVRILLIFSGALAHTFYLFIF